MIRVLRWTIVFGLLFLPAHVSLQVNKNSLKDKILRNSTIKIMEDTFISMIQQGVDSTLEIWSFYKAKEPKNSYAKMIRIAPLEFLNCASLDLQALAEREMKFKGKSPFTNPKILQKK